MEAAHALLLSWITRPDIKTLTLTLIIRPDPRARRVNVGMRLSGRLRLKLTDPMCLEGHLGFAVSGSDQPD